MLASTFRLASTFIIHLYYITFIINTSRLCRCQWLPLYGHLVSVPLDPTNSWATIFSWSSSASSASSATSASSSFPPSPSLWAVSVLYYIRRIFTDVISHWLNSWTEAYLSGTISPVSEKDNRWSWVWRCTRVVWQTDAVHKLLLRPIFAQPEPKGAFRQRVWTHKALTNHYYLQL